METLSPYNEVESKYRADENQLFAFKQLVSNLPGLLSFQYIESDDLYYVNSKSGEALRHRFDPKDLTSRQEITYKQKNSPNNNIHREEINLRVDGNSLETVRQLVNKLGFEQDFRLSKMVHLYKFKDATIPFYTVINEQGKLQSFIEIEVAEELIPELTKEQALAILVKYEKLLEPLGIYAQRRVKKSLLEIYRS